MRTTNILLKFDHHKFGQYSLQHPVYDICIVRNVLICVKVGKFASAEQK